MESENANFIPLGNVGQRAAFDGPEKPRRVQGKTKEERKQIAREIRLASKREKKKIKADAKRQRKQNAIMHRRMTRNNEKYVKNKDRNKQRAIDLERNKIRYDAVKQAEKLAAKYDMSGKLFNVGEVFITENGKVKSKIVMQRAEEEAMKEAAEAQAKADAVITIEGLNPERQAHIQGLAVQKPKYISKKQQKKQEMLAPKPVPPKPVLPEGYSLPEGEENMIALWDITDQDILRRLSNKKREKTMAAKQLRRAQKEKKKLNRAMKAMKKEAGNKKILWDPEAARKEILGEAKYLLPESDNGPDSDSNSSSDSDEASDAEVEWESDDDVKEKEKKKDKKRTRSPTSEDGEFTKNFANRPKINLTLLRAAEEKERELAQKKKLARERRKSEAKAAAEKAVLEAEAKKKEAEEAAAKATEEGVKVEIEESKKRKRSRDDEDPTAAEAEKKKKKSKKNKDHKKKEPKITESNDSKLDAAIAANIQDNGDAEPVTVQYSRPGDIKKAEREARRAARELQEAEMAAMQGVEASTHVKKAKKHRKEKKSKDTEIAVTDEIIDGESSKSRKRHKKEKKAAEEAVSNAHTGTEQWNPDALMGDDSRKDKFLRLLGAGKGGGVIGVEKSKRESGKADDIRRAEAELERQFEAGVKMKHDGGGKRRGLGA